LRKTGTETTISLGLPVKSDRHTAFPINADALRQGINLGAPTVPIPILVVVVEPSPRTIGLPIVIACGEKLEVLVAGLNDTELRTVRRDRSRHDPRTIDVPDEQPDRNDLALALRATGSGMTVTWIQLRVAEWRNLA
jgi:hypothetical protein